MSEATCASCGRQREQLGNGRYRCTEECRTASEMPETYRHHRIPQTSPTARPRQGMRPLRGMGVLPLLMAIAMITSGDSKK